MASTMFADINSAGGDLKLAPRTPLEKLAMRLSEPLALLSLSVLFVLFLAGTAYLDGVPRLLLDGGFLRHALLAPTIILYTLFVSRHLTDYSHRAVEAFRPLLEYDNDEFDRLMAESLPKNPRREWGAVGAGILFALVMFAPLDWSNTESVWLEVYNLISSTLMLSVLAWVSYKSLAETQWLSEFHRRPLKIDIFDPTPLEPVARQSLATSLAFLGGITLSVMLLPSREWLLTVPSIILYSSLILVSVLVFFITMNDTHQVMVETKERELKQIRSNLSATYRELKARAAEGQLQDMEALSDSIAAWLAYEKRIQEAPEWPYTTDTLRNLLMSTLIPVIAWASQVIVEIIT